MLTHDRRWTILKTMGRNRNGKAKAKIAPPRTRPPGDPLLRALTYENDWVARHFGDLVKNYPQKIVAVVEHAVAGVGATGDEALAVAKEKFPSAIPLLVSVPAEEDMKCVVLFSRTPGSAPTSTR